MNKLWVQYQGGLGNQLFSWAAGYAMARKLNCELVLVPKARNQPEFDLWRFYCAFSRRHRPFDQRVFRVSALFGRGPHEGVKVEKARGFDPEVAAVSPGDFIGGYLQSPKYFQDYAHEIITSLQTLRVKSAALAGYHSRFSGMEWIAVHVRLGDYLNFPETYLIPSATYYSRAIRQVKAEIPNARIVLFSNDVDGARKLVPDSDEIIGPSDLKSAAETMHLMSTATSIVGANSTLSWWSAYIGSGVSGRHVFPSRWFSNPRLSAAELLLPEFETLDPETGL